MPEEMNAKHHGVDMMSLPASTTPANGKKRCVTGGFQVSNSVVV